MSEHDRLALTGDTIALSRLSARRDDGFEEVVDRVRSADFSFTNFELCVRDPGDGYPAPGRDMTIHGPPWIAEEVARMGFDAVSAANNHVGDFSHGGLLSTMAALEAADLPYAGLGRDRTTARAPTYVETTAGRVGVVAATTTFAAADVAGPTGPETVGRPGVSQLGMQVEYRATDDTVAKLRDASERLGLEAVKERNEAAGLPAIDGEDTFSLVDVGGAPFRVERGEEDGFRWRLLDNDRRAILQRIHEADRQADRVICSLHTHEGAGGHFADRSVPSCVEAFARECIDAGADVFVGHGPNVVRGIEIYDGRPIFYSLGDFVVQELLIERLPAEVYDRHGVARHETPADVFDAIEAQYLTTRELWESVLPVCAFDGGELARIDLHPLDLGYERDRPHQGVPRPADEETGRRILADLADQCDAYGVEVEIESNVGTVRP